MESIRRGESDNLTLPCREAACRPITRHAVIGLSPRSLGSLPARYLTDPNEKSRSATASRQTVARAPIAAVGKRLWPQRSRKVVDMSNIPSRVQWEDLVRAETWAPWTEGWAETPAYSPLAARASVARFKAINDKIEAYEKGQRRQPGGDDSLASLVVERLGHSS